MEGLIIVPTPIGNLGDITQRSLDVLSTVDFILAEDTRTSGLLLKHYDLKGDFFPFHAHNEHKVLEKVIEKLKSGQKAALISDAGTPGISDPGFLLIRECINEKIPVLCLPGATAFTPALVVSGFPTDRFCFEGFLPHKKGRQSRVEAWLEEERTIVMYESPHRLLKTLELILKIIGDERKVSISREISKKFEETIRGTVTSCINHFTKNEPRGEFVVVLEGKQKIKKSRERDEFSNLATANKSSSKKKKYRKDEEE